MQLLQPRLSPEGRRMSIPSRLLTVPETAERLGYSTKTVWRLIRSGRLVARRLQPGSPWRVAEADLSLFIDQLDTNQVAS